MDVWLAAAERQRTHGDLVNLSAGQPSAGAPAAVRAAAREALDTTVLGYTVALGIPELRTAIANSYQLQHGLVVDPNEVVITTGSSGGFLLAFLACFDVGDRVAIGSPGYPCYRNILSALGCEVVEIPCGPETRFQPTARHLDHLTAERRQDVAVTRIAGACDRHPVTDVEAGQERQQEPARRAGGDHHLVGLDDEPVPRLIGARRSPRAVRGCPARRCNRGRWCRAPPRRGAHRPRVRPRWAGPRTGSPGRRGCAGVPRRPPHVHHVERRDPCPQRDAVVGHAVRLGGAVSPVHPDPDRVHPGVAKLLTSLLHALAELASLAGRAPGPGGTSAPPLRLRVFQRRRQHVELDGEVLACGIGAQHDGELVVDLPVLSVRLCRVAC